MRNSLAYSLLLALASLQSCALTGITFAKVDVDAWNSHQRASVVQPNVQLWDFATPIAEHLINIGLQADLVSETEAKSITGGLIVRYRASGLMIGIRGDQPAYLDIEMRDAKTGATVAVSTMQSLNDLVDAASFMSRRSIDAIKDQAAPAPKPSPKRRRRINGRARRR